MRKQIHPKKPCDRCGRPRHVRSDAKTNICTDCHQSDPTYVQAVLRGSRCA